MGLPWCVVHLPLYLGNDRGAVPPALSLAVTLFSVLLPYRVLMVWVYDRTQSVLMAMLMRLPLVVSYPHFSGDGRCTGPGLQPCLRCDVVGRRGRDHIC